jgi:TatD DNase family protein
LAVIDTHCHLDACEERPEALVDRARRAGVNRVLAIGMNGSSSRLALAAADGHPEVFVAVGRHPHESEGWADAALAELEELAGHPKVRAIGEAGLDYKRDYAPREDQRRAFIAQLELAGRLGLPFVLHTRQAEADTLDLLARHGDGVSVIVHCFSLTGQLEECLDRGYFCSFAGNVTYPKATELQAAAAKVPDDLLLVETDAPFLSPQDERGKPNEPAFVRSTATFLARLRGVRYEDLERTIEENAARLFRW